MIIKHTNMLTKKFWLIIAVMAIFASCNNTEQKFVARVKMRKITEKEMYDKYLVADVVFDAEEITGDSLRTRSRIAFLKGIEQYKNKKDPNGAIKLFKDAILILPDAKAYYELGNALMESGKGKAGFEEALQAFRVAEYLNFKPQANMYYKMAVCENMTMENGQDWAVIGYLRDAFKAGFTDTAMIAKDVNLRSIIHESNYIGLMAELGGGAFKNTSSDLFKLYLKSFPLVSQPYEISFAEVGNTGRDAISYDFAVFIPEMQNTSFGRETSHDFYAIARFEQTPNYVAVIYSSVNFTGEEMQPVSTKLVTYDNEGNIIGSKLFACQFSAEKIKKGRIENNEIVLEDYERIWAKPIDEVPFEDNHVDEYKLLAKAQFLLDANGKFLQQSVPANYTDSVVTPKSKKILSFFK